MIPVLFTLLPLACLVGAAVLLAVLAVIDLRHYLLPNRYVFPFGLLGLIFHAGVGFTLLPLDQVVMGGLLGAGLLLAVRYGGNWYYKQESLGLGDVKLMGAAGLWLGPQALTIALTLGALAGLVHGLSVAAFRAMTTRAPFSVARLVIPAGPGFIVGIVVMIFYDYHSFIQNTLVTLLAP